MAGKEGQPQQDKGAIDKGLETWQNWNKVTLTAEGFVIIGGIFFGVPWVVGLAATGAAIDGVQIIGINEVQKKRQKKKLTSSADVYKKAA